MEQGNQHGALDGIAPTRDGDSPVEPVVGKRELGLVMVALFVSALLSALDQTIFGTTLPTIVGELRGIKHMLWVTTAYILAATITMPIYGKLGDLLGRKRLLLVALALFLGGSVLGGLAGSMRVLVAARGVQGLGGGGLMTLGLAIVADIVPPRRRGTYLGLLVAAWSFASVLGPVLGGWFADSLGWRWAFWFNLPLGAIAIIVVLAFLRAPLKKKARVRLDVAGMVTMAIATTAIILLVSWGGREYGWASPVILSLAGVAIVVGALLVFIESKAAEPIIPLHFFRDRNFNLVTVGGLLTSLAFLGVIIYMPSYLQMVTGLSATKSGLLLVPLAIGILGTSVGTGMLVGKTGRYKWMPPVGAVLMALSLYLLSTLTVSSSFWLACFYMFVHGLGNGIGLQVLNLIVQNAFRVTEVGSAIGAFSFFKQIGASLGSAVVGTLFTGRLIAQLTERLGSVSGATSVVADPNSLTPTLVAQLPENVKSAIVASYNEALTPVYLYIVPLVLLATVLFLFVKEKPLALTNELPADQPLPAGSATD